MLKKFSAALVICIAILTISLIWSDCRRSSIHNQQLDDWIAENQHKVKVLYIYPSEYKGQIHGHYAIVEGLINKNRMQVNTSPALPIPGETWTVDNHNGSLRLVEKQ